MEKNNIVVSVCCITFNHEPFMRECLDGFMMQKTNFHFEVLIHDDASADNTAQIIREYESKHPDIIKPIYQIENQWSKGINRIQSIYNFPRARGKYIALCEGDDYWTDPLKLQKQVDFLEANEEYSMCVSNRLVKTIDGEYFKDLLSKKTITLEDVLRGQILHTQTMLFLNKGNELIDFLSDLIKEGNGGDREIGYFYALKRSIYCLPDVTAVYRMSGTGVWSRFSEQEKVWLELDAFYHFHKRIKFANRKLFANEYTKKSLDIVYYAWKRKQTNPFKWKVIKSLCKRLTIAELISEIVNYGLCKIRRKK